MSVSPEIAALARQWIERAEHDFLNAAHTLKILGKCPYDTVCFHAQQGAEKYLKALLVLLEIDFPKTHNLTALIAHMPPTLRMRAYSIAAAELNPYAVEARYPGDWGPQTRADALKALKLARRLRKAVRSRLPHDLLE